MQCFGPTDTHPPIGYGFDRQIFGSLQVFEVVFIALMQNGILVFFSLPSLLGPRR